MRSPHLLDALIQAVEEEVEGHSSRANAMELEIAKLRDKVKSLELVAEDWRKERQLVTNGSNSVSQFEDPPVVQNPPAVDKPDMVLENNNVDTALLTEVKSLFSQNEFSGISQREAMERLGEKITAPVSSALLVDLMDWVGAKIGGDTARYRRRNANKLLRLHKAKPVGRGEYILPNRNEVASQREAVENPQEAVLSR